MNRSARMNWLPVGLTLGLLIIHTSCSGGGGGSGTAEASGAPRRVELIKVDFPDPSKQKKPRSDAGPTNVALSQTIRFHFSGNLNTDTLQNDGIRVLDRLTLEERPGTLKVTSDPKIMVFEPLLPLVETELDGITYKGDRDYECVFALGNPSLPSNVAAISPSVLSRFGSEEPDSIQIVFRTTADPTLYWPSFDSPDLIDSAPKDGETSVSSFAFKDRDKNSGVILRFDSPLDPRVSNLALISLLDQLNSSDQPVDRIVPSSVELVTNDLSKSIVRILPLGPLPLGHRLSVVIDQELRSLSGDTGLGIGQLVTFDVIDTETPIDDVLLGIVEDSDFEETDAIDLDKAPLVGDWAWLDDSGSRVLKAGEGFPGQGELGPFIPDLAPGQLDRTMTLNTDIQRFPIPDGSTPGAPATTVYGGQFNFEYVIIPAGITVRGSGTNPLVITSLGDIRIHGLIDVSGRRGTSEGASTDNAVGPLAGGEGGSGGSRGGDGHPTILDQGKFVSPRKAVDGQGFSRGLPSGGGFSGIEPTSDFDCSADSDSANSRGANGGGGGFFTEGKAGVDGVGSLTSSELCDESGHQIYELLPQGFPTAGRGGESAFIDEDPLNDYFGVGGEYGRNFFGGGSGGGGGSRLDSYHCGSMFFWDVVADARGGGGGGGGGVLRLLALGAIEFAYNITLDSKIDARGGSGGDGQNLSFHGGAGGDGAGGLVLLSSATDVRVTGIPEGAVIQDTIFVNPGRRLTAPSNAGDGILQVELPRSQIDQWTKPADFVEPESSLIDLQRTPSSLTPISISQTRWIYIGRNQRDGGSGATYAFRGTHKSGYVRVDDSSRVINPEINDFRIDSLPLIDRSTGAALLPRRSDTVPENARIRIRFQGARESSDLPGEVDEQTVSNWTGEISTLSGFAFIRIRVTFDIARQELGYRLGDKLQIPIVRDLQIRMKY